MSDQNRNEGFQCYSDGDSETQAWFHRQWRMWPERAHPERTTNLTFHYGGVQAYRAHHGKEPKMSDSFKDNIEYMERDA